jgi:hypothetical protein
MTSQQGHLGNERQPSAPPGTTEPGTGHGWRAVSIVLVGAFMALLDTTIVTVALPTIRTGLHASPATLEWVISAYALAYALALVPAGRAGDRFGHKPLFLTGLPIFTLARGLRAVAEPGRDRRRPRDPGHRSRALLPGHLRDHPAVLHRDPAIEGVRRPRRHHRRVRRARAGTGRPDHRGRGCPRRLALGVPGEPAHRRGRAPDGRPAAAAGANAHPPPVRPGRPVPAVRRAAPAAHPAGRGSARGLRHRLGPGARDGDDPATGRAPGRRPGGPALGQGTAQVREPEVPPQDVHRMGAAPAAAVPDHRPACWCATWSTCHRPSSPRSSTPWTVTGTGRRSPPPGSQSCGLTRQSGKLPTVPNLPEAANVESGWPA